MLLGIPSIGTGSDLQKAGYLGNARVKTSLPQPQDCPGPLPEGASGPSPTARHSLGLPAPGPGCPHRLGLLRALGQGVQETPGEALPDLTLDERDKVLKGVEVESNFKVPFRENLRNSGSWSSGPTKCIQKTWQGFNEAIGHKGNHPSTGGGGAHSSVNNLKLQKEGHKSRN